MRRRSLFPPPTLFVRLLLAVTILTLSARGHSASADQYFPFIQITCVPELRYFAIRSFGIANTPLYFPTNRKERKMLERTHGIYTAEALARTPFDCHASMAMNSTTTLDAHVETAGKGCGAGPHVTINGRDVGILSADACGELTTTLIEATVDGDMLTIRRCDLTFPGVYPELLAHDHDWHAVEAGCRLWNPLEK